METPVPGGKNGLFGGKEQCGVQVQGIEAAQVVVKSEPWRVLDEVLVYLAHCLCCAVPAVRPTARTVSTKPMRQMYKPSVACISVRTRSLPGSAT